MIELGKSIGSGVRLSRRATFVAATLLVMASSVQADDPLWLVASTPQDGARLNRSPTDIEMIFGSPLTLRGNRIRIVRADGTVAAYGEPAVSKSFTTLHMPLLTPFPIGRYSVNWSARADAGSESSGTFSFLIGTSFH